MRAVVAAAILMSLGLAGCFNSQSSESTPPGTAASWTVEPDCATPGFEPRADSVCVTWIRGGERTHFEPHLAAHPTDPSQILVTSMYSRQGDDLDPSTVEVVAGLTRDGGATWPFATLEGSSADDAFDAEIPTTYRFAFDAIAQFDAAGNPVVLYGGEYTGYRHPIGTGIEEGQREVLHWQMTLARSNDEGASWEYDAFHENPLVLELDDYMDLAVGDTPRDIYVVTDSHGERGEPASHAAWPFTIAFWRSVDGGQTWESQALASAPSREERGFQFPRIAAGSDGLVVVTAQRFDSWGDSYAGVSAWISRDGGATFDGPVSVSDIPNTSSNLQQPTVWKDRIDVVHATSDQAMVVVRSHDGGRTWDAPRALSEAAPGRAMVVWETAVDESNGDLYALERTADDDGTGFYLTLIRWTGEHVDRVPLMDAPAVGDDGVFEGGHYAGLDVGADGSIWVAWADPRQDADPIAVARLIPT